jgi:hypothetical protein
MAGRKVGGCSVGWEDEPTDVPISPKEIYDKIKKHGTTSPVLAYYLQRAAYTIEDLQDRILDNLRNK